MIKPNELRLGNYVKYPFHELQVCQLFIDSFQGMYVGGKGCYMYESCDGIPLTSEWLLKFGFKLEDITWYDASVTKNVYCKGQYYVDMRESLGTGYLFGKMDNEYPGYRNILVRPVQYVDQIQNVFYFITGEELTIQE